MREVPVGEGHSGELLVILDPASAAGTLRRLRQSYRVTQVGSPRVLVLQISPGEPPISPSTSGVIASTAGTLPNWILKELDEGEVAFVRAWERRMAGANKERVGEGLSWDATGFEPPDNTSTN